MMNFVALFLFVSSLVTAGVCDQTQQQQQRQEGLQQQLARDQEVIVKNGHRVVVVEYDEHGHHKTKISISLEHGHPPRGESSSFSENEVSLPSKISRAFDNSMENIKEAASGLANFGQGHGEGHSPKELMCDAYGKCKHKIASAIETKKEICKETAHGAKEAGHRVGEAVENVYERAKDTVSDKAHEVEETARDTMEKVKNASKTGKDMRDTLAGEIQRNASKQREHLAEIAKEAKETAEEAAGKVKAGAGELKSDLAEKAKEAKETAEEAAFKVKAGAEELKSGTQKRLHQLRNKGREFWYGAFRSIASGDLLEGLLSVAHLFGLATAYGMCMWITFVSSHVLAGSLPPQQFGMVQSKIYKVYFKAMAYSVGMALLGHLWRHRSSLFRGKAADMLQNYNLIAALSMILFNMMYLEPRSTKVMFERMKIEKEEGRGSERVHVDARISREASRQQQQQQQTTTEGEPSITTPPQVSRREQQVVEPDIDGLNEMRKRLKKLNTYSSFLNIASLMALSWRLVYLAQYLPTSCC